MLALRAAPVVVVVAPRATTTLPRARTEPLVARASSSSSSSRPSRPRHRVVVAASDDDAPGAPTSADDDAPSPAPTPAPLKSGGKGGGKRRADSTDAVASFLTRRFGVAGGLAWLGVLTFGVVSEQLKTRREVREAVEGTTAVAEAKRVEVATESGLRYVDIVVGGGDAPKNGYLLAADVVATVVGDGDENDPEVVVLDTKKTRRPLIFAFGKPTGPITRGVMEGVSTMRQGGVRVMTVPANVGFGSEGATLSEGTVPPGATLRYELELTRVSVPPS